MSSFALLLLHRAVHLNLLIRVYQRQGFPVKVLLVTTVWQITRRSYSYQGALREIGSLSSLSFGEKRSCKSLGVSEQIFRWDVLGGRDVSQILSNHRSLWRTILELSFLLFCLNVQRKPELLGESRGAFPLLCSGQLTLHTVSQAGISRLHLGFSLTGRWTGPSCSWVHPF